MDPLRPQLREPVTFVQRVLYSDAFDKFLGGAVTVLLAGVTFVAVFFGIAAINRLVHDDGRTQGHAEVSGTENKLHPMRDRSYGVAQQVTTTTGNDNVAIGNAALSNIGLGVDTTTIRGDAYPDNSLNLVVQPQHEWTWTASERPKDNTLMLEVASDYTATSLFRNMGGSSTPMVSVSARPGKVAIHDDKRTFVMDLMAKFDASDEVAYCASKDCRKADFCWVFYVEDQTNHVLATLPCVAGKVGTWQITPLP